MKTKDTLEKTHDERVAEIDAIEAAAAQKRAELLVFNEAENIRRQPLNKLLHERLNLIKVIGRNKLRIEAHARDAADFEKKCDSFFYNDSTHQSLVYSFLTPTLAHPFAMAGRAVELLTDRLEKAKKDLVDLESKIVTEAEENDLREMLPPELCK